MPVTPANLAGYIQADVNTYSAQQAIDGATSAFEAAAGIKLSPTSATYEAFALGQCKVWLPDYPVTAVASVTVAGVAVTDYSRVGQILYRSGGFGDSYTDPPVALVVTYTHGLADVTPDIKAAILDTAASAYLNPGTTIREQIDDYSSTVTTAGFQLSRSARALAELYRRPAVA